MLKTSAALTETEWLSRCTIWESALLVLDGDDNDTAPSSGMTKPKFMEIYDSFRELCYAMALPVINTHFATEFNSRYPEFMFGGTRKVHNMDDFCDLIHMFAPSKEVTLQQVRAMVHFCLYGMWGKSNFWAEKGELHILHMLGLEYDGNRMSDKSVQKRKQRGGFVKSHAVKKLDMERTKVKEAWKRCFMEKIFKRDAYKPKNKKDSDTDHGNEDTSRKRKPDQSHLRKYVVFATRESHGFDGCYLLCDEHPERKRMDGLPTKTKEEEQTEKKEEFIQNISNHLLGSKRDISSILSDLHGKVSADDNGEELPGLVALLNAFKGSGGTKCAIPQDIAINTGAAPKKAKFDDVDSSTATGESMSDLMSDFSAEKVGHDADCFQGLEVSELVQSGLVRIRS